MENTNSTQDLTQNIIQNIDTNNIIMDMYLYKYDTLEVLLKLFTYMIQSTKIDMLYNPRPTIYVEKHITTEYFNKILKVKYRNKIINPLNSLVDDYMKENNFTSIDELKQSGKLKDKYIYDALPNYYITIAFAICNLTRYTFKKSSMFNKDSLKTLGLDMVIDVDSEGIDDFKDSVNDYLYHGSGFFNWFSIITNGLKNASGTALMVNGAAYGQGIYMSNNIDVSISYSGSINSDKISIIGIFQVLNPAKTYEKCNGIYVIPNEKEVKLRFIYIINNNGDYKTLSKTLNDLYGGEIKQKIIMKNEINNQIGAKRLIKEYKNYVNTAEENYNKYGLYFTVSLNEVDNLSLWYIDIDRKNIIDNVALYKDMEELKIDNIRLEISFPYSYPLEPPFIRVLLPRFIFMTGHITAGGSICMQNLTKSGFSPAVKIDKILMQIVVFLNETNPLTGNSARIDKLNYDNPYSQDDAKQAFDRMVKKYNW